MDLQRINELIQKYADGTATEAEKATLTAWYREQAYHDAIFQGDEDEVYHELLNRINGVTGLKPIRTRWKSWAAAASVAILLATGMYLSKHSANEPAKQIAAVKQQSNNAILTLSNGSQIVLSSTANGHIANQGNVSVTKTANGQLVYHINEDAEKQPAKNSVAYNTISTPAGVQYMIVLPDKTTVWLNAKSSLKFPVTFQNARERDVALTGEAYFEVTHNEQMPFKVSTGEMITEDLGTAFNINAYADEPGIRTTLVNGAVRVTAGNSQVMLHPGEQAHYQGKMIVSKVNVDGIVAWKDGYFRFDDETLESIMRTMSRWYNVSYVFEDEDLRKETFGIMATRAGNISGLLSLLEKTGPARFRLEGTTIIISHKN